MSLASRLPAFFVAASLFLVFRAPSVDAQTDHEDQVSCLSGALFHAGDYWSSALEVLDCSATYIQSRTSITPDLQNPIDDAIAASGLKFAPTVDELDGLETRIYPFCGVHQTKFFEAFDFTGLTTVTLEIEDTLAGLDPLIELSAFLARDLGQGLEFVLENTDTDGNDGWSLTLDVSALSSLSALVIEGKRGSDTVGPESGRLVAVGDSGVIDNALEPVRDNTLYEIAGGTLSNGAGSWLFSGLSLQPPGRRTRRAVLGFDIASQLIPPFTVVRADLDVFVTRTPGNPVTMGLHRVSKAFGEGTSNALGEEGLGAASTSGDATWEHAFFPSDLWTAPGGDFDPIPLATVDMSLIGPYRFPTNVTFLQNVLSMVDDPASDLGFVLIGDESFPGTVKRFGSKNNANPLVRPQLVVQTIPRATGASWNLYGEGWTGTNGIPSIGVDGEPSIGATIRLELGNTRGSTTPAVLLVGIAPSNTFTALDGTLLVLPLVVIPIIVPPLGLAISTMVPDDDGFCNVRVFIQVLHTDPGASKGVSFTRGLKILISE